VVGLFVVAPHERGDSVVKREPARDVTLPLVGGLRSGIVVFDLLVEFRERLHVVVGKQRPRERPFDLPRVLAGCLDALGTTVHREDHLRRDAALLEGEAGDVRVGVHLEVVVPGHLADVFDQPCRRDHEGQFAEREHPADALVGVDDLRDCQHAPEQGPEYRPSPVARDG